MADVFTRLVFEEDLGGLDRSAAKLDEMVATFREVDQVSDEAFSSARKVAADYQKQLIQVTNQTTKSAAETDQLRKAITAQNRVTLEMQNRLAAVTAEYNKLDSKGKKAATGLKTQMAALRAEIKASSLQAQEYRQRIDELNKGFGDTGKQIKLTQQEAANLAFQFNDVFTQIGSGQGVLRTLIQQGPQITQVFGGVGNTFRFFGQQALGAAKNVATLRGGMSLLGKATGALIIVSVLAFFAKFANAGGKLDRVLAGIGGVVDALVGRLAKLGGGLVQILSGNFAEGFNQIGQAFTGIADEAERAFNAASNLEKLRQDLVKREREAGVETAKTLKRQQELNQVYQDETKSLQARTAARRELGRVNDQVLLREQNLTAEALKIAKAKAAEEERGGKISKGTLDELAEARTAYFEAEAARQQAAFDTENDVNALRRQGIEQAKQARKESEASTKALQAELDKLGQLIAANDLQALKDREAAASGEERLRLTVERIKAEEQLAAAEIAALEKVVREKAAAAGKAFTADREFQQLRAQLAEETGRQLVAAELAYDAEVLNAQDAANTERLDNIEATRQRELDLIDRRKELALAEVDAVRAGTDAILTLEQEKAKKKLEIERDALNERLPILAAQYGENSIEAQLIRKQIQIVENELAGFANIRLDPLEALRRKIMDALNIGPEELQILEQAGAQIVGNIRTAVDANLQAAAAELDKELAGFDERISKLQDALKTEQELKKDGFANNVALLEDQLKKENEARKKAADERAKLEKKQAGIRIAIEAAQQVSALGLAAARLIAAEAFKGIAGIAFAAAGVGLIFSLVAQVRAQAKAASANIPEYREGGELVNGLQIAPKHEQGGKTLQDRSGRLYSIEGGEFVVSAAQTNRHKPILDAVNSGAIDAMHPLERLKLVTSGRSIDDLFRIPDTVKRIRAKQGDSTRAGGSGADPISPQILRTLEQIRDKPEHETVPLGNGDLLEITREQGRTTKKTIKNKG